MEEPAGGSSTASEKQGGQNEFHRLRVLLEPKGFIRIIEFVLAVLMFATTAGYSGSYQYTIKCTNYFSRNIYNFAYPFNFEPFQIFCDATNTSETDVPIKAYPGGSASFFVAIGVFAMIYCILTLIWYVFLEVKFLSYDLVPIVDFVTTVVFAAFFFFASCAWAAGVGTVKYWTNFENVKKDLLSAPCNNPANVCAQTTLPNYASLNISVVFGFLNIVVWAGNAWFVFKETSWFQKRQDQNQQGTAQPKPENTI